MKEKIIGIMAAMTEEVKGVIALIENRKEIVFGMRSYYTGELNGVKVVVTFSRWGKVAAATTVTTLITKFGVAKIIFTGVAGAIHTGLRIGDIVIGNRLVQHDMNSSPMYPQYEIPLHHITFFDSDSTLRAIASQAVRGLIEEKVFENDDFAAFNIDKPELFIGDIASGDQFFSTNEQKVQLHNALPSVLCVEMEGAAVAQICYEYNIPCIVIRTISDTADEKSHIDFMAFTKKIASFYSAEIIKRIVTTKNQ